MSQGWNSFYELCNASDQGTVTGSSIGTTLTASGTANAKGSYVQLVASTPTDTDWLMVTVLPPGSSLATFAVDIAIGASGSELVIAPTLTTSGKSSAGGPQGTAVFYMFPCAIPAGTRIAARAQSSTASLVGHVQVTLFPSNFADGSAGSIVDAVGFSAATTLGTSPTPGTNAQGSYAQLVAATSYDYAGFFLGFDFQNNSAGSTFYSHLVNLAIGASGSEKVILPNLSVSAWCQNSNIINPSNTPYFPISIPAGTRIAVSDSVSATGGPNIGVTLYGVRK